MAKARCHTWRNIYNQIRDSARAWNHKSPWRGQCWTRLKSSCKRGCQICCLSGWTSGPREMRSCFECHPSRRQFFLSWNRCGTGKKLLAENSAAFHYQAKCSVKRHNQWWRTITQNSAAAANISCLVLQATPLALFLLCALFGCL